MEPEPRRVGGAGPPRRPRGPIPAILRRALGHAALATGLLLAAACATRIVPAPTADRLPGPGAAALAEAAGVRVIVAADAWRGFPADLAEAVTPMLVTIHNGSERQLMIRYEHFALTSPEGRRFAALPPFEITGVVSEPVPGFHPPVRFGVAPYLSRWYPGWTVFGGPFPFHTAYYDAFYPAFTRVALPTGDMVQKALPEGVVEPGGRVAGFVYFEEVKDVEVLTFAARLVEPSAATPFAEVRLPFVVD